MRRASPYPGPGIHDDERKRIPLIATEKVLTPLDYTVKDIHDAIPPHCFQPHTLLSIAYVLRDISFILILICTATYIPGIENSPVRVLTWALYAFVQGLVFTGMWELAHECGHGALSKHKAVNNTMGLLMHSFLLVPYYSWRITHSQHHKATNNLERDIAFVPDIKADWDKKRSGRGEGPAIRMWEMVEDTPIVALLTLCGHQLVAWPTYLLINNFALKRMAAAPWWKRSHFYIGGDGPNFKPASRRVILISDMGITVMAIVLWACTRVFGRWNVLLLYGGPWLWTNHWILTITFLQHTDFSLPYYSSKTWSFLRGAASTVDRDFGFIGRHIFHGAIETHVLHHHSSRIPFYYAAEASHAIRGVMGTYYKSDFKTPYLCAFWKNYRNCRFVEEIGEGSDIYFFSKSERSTIAI